jgi:hypothetical protein
MVDYFAGAYDTSKKIDVWLVAYSAYARKFF